MGNSERSPGDPSAYFEDWSREDLVEYAGFLMHSYRVMDAFWFLNVEKDQGLDRACHYNELVWRKVGSLATRDIKKRFGIDESGLKGFVRVLEHYPWHILTGYRIKKRPDEVILSVPSCPSQEGRKKHGLGEYPCKAMHAGEFESIAREVDPRIKVHCLFAPPDAHPESCYCKWRFTIEE